ncbi:hypothetical protein HSBAA_60170 [Vreelandella sulfidaeris]|uniref:TRAP C4-dicarboxylate transport system permease DctM subunit domain-containing protein n=1 Tax=Vreelandella sulfidaeris TaxID=115553 RepID=A0A455UJ68_9GAMM|nr:hypothetical protein HSBAA_60170 [Halomonas sulfidaeris]
MPPSIALIIYGSVTGTSVGRLFAAGLLPAIVIASILIAYCIVFSSIKGYERAPFPSLRQILVAFKDAAWGLGLPVILLGASTVASLLRPNRRRSPVYMACL